MARPATLPIYVQISEMLIREIAAGHLPDGERLAPERDMAADLEVSVGTLRKALADLEAKGLLERVQGSGNYVRAEGAQTESVYAFLRLELAEGGGLPTAEVLDVARMPKPEGAPAFGPSTEGFRIRRLRRLGGVPAAVEEIWLDAARAEQIEAGDLSDSLYLFYRHQLGFWITAAEDRVGTGTVPGWAPAAFGQPPGAHCGHIERVSIANDGGMVEYSRTWFDAEKARYINRLR